MKKFLLFLVHVQKQSKMAPVIKELKKHKKNFKVKICVTGQHSHMLKQVLNLFKIKVDFNLNVMKKIRV